MIAFFWGGGVGIKKFQRLDEGGEKKAMAKKVGFWRGTLSRGGFFFFFAAELTAGHFGCRPIHCDAPFSSYIYTGM